MEAVCGFSSQPWCFSFLRSCQCRCSMLLQNGVELCDRNFGSAIKINTGGWVHNPCDRFFFKKKKSMGLRTGPWGVPHLLEHPPHANTKLPLCKKNLLKNIVWQALLHRSVFRGVFVVQVLCDDITTRDLWHSKAFDVLGLWWADGTCVGLLFVDFFLSRASGWHQHQNPWGYTKTRWLRIKENSFVHVFKLWMTHFC